MPFAKVIKAKIVGRIHGQETNNIMWFGTDLVGNDVPSIIPILTQLAAHIVDCAVQQLLNGATSDWTFEKMEMQHVHPFLTDPIEVAAPANSVGQRGTVNASFETVLMKITTGLGGKTHRGRNFLPPPGDADLVNSLLIDGPTKDWYTGFVTCLIGKFVGPTASTPFHIGVLSRKWLKDHANDYNGAFTEATFLSVDPRLTHLHSRKVGVGN